MATIQVTNRVTSSALKSQGVKVTLDQTDVVDNLGSIVPGQSCVADSSTKEGIVDSVDYEGNSFIVVPKMPSDSFKGSADGKLVAADTVTITV